MPLDLFPIWIQNQYNLKQFVYKGYVHLEMQRAVWGLPQAGILANKHLQRKLAPFGYFKKSTPLGYGTTYNRRSHSYSSSMILALSMSMKQMLIIWWPASNQLTHSPKIGSATYIAALLLLGIMIKGLLTFRCQDTLKETAGIQACQIKQDTNVSIHTCPQAIWIRSPTSTPGRQFSPPQQKGQNTCTTNCGEHSVLCTSGGHDCIIGSKHNCNQADESD